jgi:hypothetical protein
MASGSSPNIVLQEALDYDAIVAAGRVPIYLVRVVVQVRIWCSSVFRASYVLQISRLRAQLFDSWFPRIFQRHLTGQILEEARHCVTQEVKIIRNFYLIQNSLAIQLLSATR